MSLKVYSKTHKKEIRITAFIDYRKVGYGDVSPVTKSYKIGTGAPAAYSGHNGLDMCGNDGDPIYSVTDGVVRVNTYEKNGAGNYVSIGCEKDGKEYHLLYMHMKERSKLKKGDKIKEGDLIGYQGTTGHSTGSHLHLGVKHNGKYCDPYLWITETEKKEEFDMTAMTGIYNITATGLNVRDNYNKGNIVGKISKDSEVSVIGVHIDSKQGSWGNIGDGKWICLETANGEKYAEYKSELPNCEAKLIEARQIIEELAGDVAELSNVVG